MILSICLNPALDITINIDKWQENSTIISKNSTKRAGGKTINVSRILHSEKIPNILLTTKGGETGKIIHNDLTKNNINTALVDVSAETRTCYSIFATKTNNTSIINEPGGNYSNDEWQKIITRIIQLLKHTKVLIISGSVPPETKEKYLQEIFSAAQKRNIKIIADLQKKLLLSAAKNQVDLLKPNQEEIIQATGIKNPDSAAQYLLKLGAKAILLSKGSEGMKLFIKNNSKIYSAKISEKIIGNPTGAGDASVAAAASILLENIITKNQSDITEFSDEIIHNMLKKAVSWSASAVLMPYAGEISPQHEKLFKKVNIQEENVS